MNVPHSMQNTRSRGLAASQSQQVTEGEIACVLAAGAGEAGSGMVAGGGTEAGGAAAGGEAGRDWAERGGTAGGGSATGGGGGGGGGDERSATVDEEGMDAPDLGLRSAADDTSESHSPQNAVSAWTGAPHAGQTS